MGKGNGEPVQTNTKLDKMSASLRTTTGTHIYLDCTIFLQLCFYLRCIIYHRFITTHRMQNEMEFIFCLGYQWSTELGKN